MNKGEKRFIHIILIVIAISSVILIIKISKKEEYDPELYAKIYDEYHIVMNEVNEEIFETENTGDENNNNGTINENNMSNTNQSNTTYKSDSAINQYYSVDGEIMIPKLKLVYPVINKTTMENLKIAPTKLTGPEMNEVGNYCIAGHNYKNDQFFSHLSQLEINDFVKLTSKNGRRVMYQVYAIYEVDESDFSCTDQNTDGAIEVTLITCATENQKRLIVKCRATN